MQPRSVIAFLVAFANVRGYNDEPSVDFGRLPEDTEPERYALSVVPDFDAVNPSFAGRVDISIVVKTTTDEITLNSKDLVLHEIRLTDDDTNGDVRVDSWKYAEDREQVKIKVDGLILAKQKYTIHIRYSGYMNDDASYIFHSSYDTYPRDKKWLADNSQLQTTRARSSFPCYDEPHFKKPFDVSIKIKRNEIVLSNMPILNIDKAIEDDSTEYNYTWVHFIQTPPISTSMITIFVVELKQLDKFRQRLSHVDRLDLDKYIKGSIPGQLNAIRKYKKFASDPSESSSVSYSTEIQKSESTSTPVASDSTSVSYSMTTEILKSTSTHVATSSSSMSYGTTMEKPESTSSPIARDSTSVSYDTTTEILEFTSTPIARDSSTMSYDTTTATLKSTSTHIPTDSSSVFYDTTTETLESTSTHIPTDSSSVFYDTTTEILESTSTSIARDSSTMSYDTTTATLEPTSTSVTTDSSSIVYVTTTEQIESTFYNVSETTTLSTSVEPQPTPYSKTSTEPVSTSEPFEPTTYYTTSTYKSTTTVMTSEPFYGLPYFLLNLIFTSVIILFALLISTVFFWKKSIRKNVNNNNINISA